MDEPKIDEEIQGKEPLDAFNWLLDQFRGYTYNKLSWIDVRTVLANAYALRQKYEAAKVIEIDIEVKEIIDVHLERTP
jgi:hypothetical protein